MTGTPTNTPMVGGTPTDTSTARDGRRRDLPADLFERQRAGSERRLRGACVDGSVVVGVQPTPTNTPTNTRTPTGQTGGTPSATPTPQPTSTSGVPPMPTRRFHFADRDSWQTVAAAESRPALVLLLPAALLLAARRRQR